MVPLLDLEQVPILITKFINGQAIGIYQILAPKISTIVYEVLKDTGDTMGQDGIDDENYLTN